MGFVLLLSGRVSAAGPSVSIPPGPFSNGQTITVSGSGFPSYSQDLTGLQIIECADPGGSAANLPIDAASGCEGTTVNPSQISTDTQGRFQTSYLIQALSTTGTSSINCDATHDCVLWVGTDYNNAFLSGPHAFTKPFTIVGSVAPSTTTAPPSSTTTAAPSVPSPTAGSAAADNPAAGSSSVAITNPATSPVGASAGTSPEASLPSTGVSGLTVWSLAAGLVLTFVGLVGRRLTAERRLGLGAGEVQLV
jgi:hypothetical protein